MYQQHKLFIVLKILILYYFQNQLILLTHIYLLFEYLAFLFICFVVYCVNSACFCLYYFIIYVILDQLLLIFFVFNNFIMWLGIFNTKLLLCYIYPQLINHVNTHNNVYTNNEIPITNYNCIQFSKSFFHVKSAFKLILCNDLSLPHDINPYIHALFLSYTYTHSSLTRLTQLQQISPTIVTNTYNKSILVWVG